MVTAFRGLLHLDSVELCATTGGPAVKRPSTSAELGRQYRKRRAELPEPWGMPCPFCRRPMLASQRLQTDHVVPRAFGGSDSPLRWSHGRCNERAGAQLGNRLRSAPRRPKPNSKRFG